MQAALQSEAKVQQYIDAMLCEAPEGSAPREPVASSPAVPGQRSLKRAAEVAAKAPAEPPSTTASLVPPDRLAASQPVPLAGPMAAATAMPGLDGATLKALRAAMLSATGRAAAAMPQQRSLEAAGPVTPAKTPDSQAAPAAFSDADADAALDFAGVEGNGRHRAFLKHLAAAQQRTAGRTGHTQQKRPSALAQAPAWVDSERLRCLVFKVANLQLALPVSYLEGVRPLDPSALRSHCAAGEDLPAAFAEVCLGLLDEALVLDTARIVMPERYLPGMREGYRQALRVRDMRWHLAVDSIGGEHEFDVQQVRWRSQHTRREWLAGTVIDRMCAIVDVDALHRSLLAASVLENGT